MVSTQPHAMTSWAEEIDHRRSVVNDQSPMVAAVWLPFNDEAGKPDREQLTRWQQGENRIALDEFLRRRFDGGYGGTAGEPFVMWTERFAYFSAQHAGAEWADAVPLHWHVPFVPDHFPWG